MHAQAVYEGLGRTAQITDLLVAIGCHVVCHLLLLHESQHLRIHHP